MEILKIFSKKWILVTILIALSMALFVWLGFWQLDRLEQKRTYNTTMAERWRQEPFDLNAEQLPQSLDNLEFRRITADGYFDYASQIILKSQIYYDAPGIALVTPFVFADGRAVLVARGWVPADQASPQAIAQLEEPAGAPVLGLIKPSQAPPNGQPSTPPATPQSEWFRIDIPAIQAQMPYALEPAWIQQLPETGRPIDKLPIREEPMALDEGNHMSYAVQWFSFALIAGFGYIMFVRYRERLASRPQLDNAQVTEPATQVDPVLTQEQAPTSEAAVQKELEPPVPV
ncbi:MAG: SURF1 family protein [Caldilinea sp.]|nr:SURF1 family protein [Caldilineaceae bacterium]MCB9125067.1 SURF1 family protein [Caldilineaceae bacterium]MCO5209846.1 SURF1 family protein [Caldilinea sp.]MCW5844326.1 SURF1 family protein [Caldilinea sp.]